jgi:hypothetical protein
MTNLFPLLKVPDTVEVSMREKDGTKFYFLLNHQNSPVRIQFYKPMHDFLTGQTFTGNYDLPSHGVLVLDETAPVKEEEKESTQAEQPAPAIAEEGIIEPVEAGAVPA